ncbi:hypothetical protein [Massilia pseudoviolaceinigra]|uniref:hypothetical protein n=1 Tax=Massilia pseudoviolaceinigra TaxID=3057165 RepID=UPI002796CDE3|nr:hypothetical protein [Massilia sp. CCM 9206]MDQ1923799.1 hypothetical protein [Massilia sp. CCM 9206]
MARKPHKHINLAKENNEKALNDAAPAPLACAGFSELTVCALQENAKRARVTPPRPLSKGDFARLLDEAQDAA